MGIEVILPAPIIQRRDVVSFKQLYEEWRVASELAHPVAPLENIRFIHNPDWRTANIFSITNAREQNHWIWKATSIAFSMGASTTAAAGLMSASPFALAGALFAVPLVVRWIKRNGLTNPITGHKP